MSDLQCPATILLIAPDSIASRGAPAILGAARPSGVFVASAVAADPGALAAATALAGASACRLTIVPDLADGPGLARALQELADLHRGETIALLATRAMMEELLGKRSAGADPIAITVDASGWSLADRTSTR